MRARVRTSPDSWKPLGPGLTRAQAINLEAAFKALADETRLQILCCLLMEPVMGVDEFQRDLQISQPLTSHHLGRLVDVGILQRAKRGRRSVYWITEGALETLSSVLDVAPTA